MNNDLAAEILRNIEISGSVDEKVRPIIGNNLEKVLTKSSGLPKIQTNVVGRFKLILSQPLELSILNPFEIRCCLCKRVVTYPAWYYSLKYAVNHFHYFICFDAASSDKPTAKCYKRDV